MARQARMAFADLPHLVVLPGLKGVDLVRDAVDADAARDTLRRVAADERVAVHGFGFGATHLAWLVTPTTDLGVSRMAQGFGRVYVSAYNRRHVRTGTLFAGRFRAAVVAPDGHALLALREAEAAAGSSAEVGRSSRAHHEGRSREPWLVPLAAYWKLGNTPFERERHWALSAEQPPPVDWAERLRRALGAAGALGDAEFVAACRARAGRAAQPRGRGRPRAAGQR